MQQALDTRHSVVSAIDGAHDHCTTDVSMSEYVSEIPEVSAPTSPRADTKYVVTEKMMTTESRSNREAIHRPNDSRRRCHSCQPPHGCSSFHLERTNSDQA
ncbi:hypothetical protein Pcac1_g10935 [Phytophthora cactorum]|uniref:Uncharacterized protein n=1 Tax=Phytophthora cactorum TaxID=29920 RepID=A0A8T1BVF0_9STRA|nr:hypothetical protein Pcac1_g10935 [Phytophthora cactorum]KAG2880510.1 hypothetical protein PC114_g22051 [Phytophthora cactorum]KAG2909298.1 hypothetical protein PC117_g19706 [Phytophthora cactorum]KAG3000409.1 hypothetical protein PC119_g17019 [Phytophthora cactorum]KAG3152864.1 hypothetical protein PC128_g22694 [Phytophthora cactorum]